MKPTNREMTKIIAARADDHTARVTAEDVEKITKMLSIANKNVADFLHRQGHQKIGCDLIAAIDALRPIVERLKKEIGQCPE